MTAVRPSQAAVPLYIPVYRAPQVFGVSVATIYRAKDKGEVERSYARSDLLDQRRAAMEAWAAWVTSAPAAGATGA